MVSMAVLVLAIGCGNGTATPAPAASPSPTVVPVVATLQPEPTATTQPEPTATAAPARARATPVPPAPTVSPTARPTPISPTPAVVVAMQLPNVADTVERVRPAVVSIVVEIMSRDMFGRMRSGFGSGTGVIIDPQGLVLTNNHVVEGASGIQVTKDEGSQVEAEIVGTDLLSDLAVLRIPGDNHPFLAVNPDTRPRVGEWVIAIGNALALPGGPTVTVGVVSALGRIIESSPRVTLYDLIQTDTVINPGNSGGPLISLNGQLVGINTAVLRDSGTGGPPIEGIGFAINMETAGQVSGTSSSWAGSDGPTWAWAWPT